MIYKSINLPVFVEIGKNIIRNVDTIIKNHNLYFNKPAIITGEISGKIVRHVLNLKNSTYITYKNHTDFSNIKYKIIKENYDLIVAAGGGRIIDVVKLLAYETLTPMLSIPTLLSSDSIASPISIIRFNNHYKSMGTALPNGVIVDLEIIKNSPKKFILAGLGDLVSNLSSFNDWLLSNQLKKEKINFFASNLAFLPALKILNNYQDYTSLQDYSFLFDLATGLILSGLSMTIAKSSRPCSGSEHNISHALDKLGHGEAHGIQVGASTLFTLYLQNLNVSWKELKDFYDKIGFPYCDILCKDIFIKALAMAPSIRSRYTVLNKFSIQDLIDRYNKFKKFIC